MPELMLPNKQKINYCFYKDKNKPTIVLLHGLGANLSIWQNEFNYFKKKNTSILIFDLRCHGLSGCYRKPAFKNFSEDIYLLLKKLKIPKAILAGHSLGGLISLDFYRKHPKNVSSLILIDSSYNISLKTLKPIFPLEYLLIKIVSYFSRIRKRSVALTQMI